MEMRLIVARCSVEYTGRLTARLPEALRLVMLKADGSVLVHADAGGYKPLNWMTPPTVIEEEGELIVVRKLKGEDRLEITLHEVLSDVDHLMDEDAARLEKDGVERDLQELLADAPGCCGEGFRLVRREWPTDIGPVDLMCRDEEDGWIAVEIKRVGTIDAVEQLSRYLERIRLDPAMADCAGRAGRPDGQAAGARAGRGARAVVGRGRPRGAARRARAGADTVRRMSEAGPHRGVRRRPPDHPQPPRGAQRGQRRRRRGRRRRAGPAGRRRRAARRRSSPAPAARSAPGWT